MGALKPMFSVITVCRNAAEVLRGTMESVFSQTCNDVEYIVIDGASTDGTVELLKEYEKKAAVPTDDRCGTFRFHWISEPDSGIYQAMNKGIALASGDYVHFLNAGDTYCAYDMLAVLSVEIERSGRKALYHGHIRTVSGGAVGSRFAEVSLWRLFFWNIPHPAIFYEKELFVRYGAYNESYRYAGDYEYLLRLIVGAAISPVYLSLDIVNFLEDGISSDKANEDEMRAEVRCIRDHYFPLLPHRICNRFYCVERGVRSLMKKAWR